MAGGFTPRPLLAASLGQILNASLISPLFFVSCYVNLFPSLFFSKPRFISNSNETPNFTVIFIICAKFGVKVGAQNSFLPPGAGYPSYATVRMWFRCATCDIKKKSNLHYTRRITPKRVTSCGAHLRGLAPGLHSSEETSQRWRVVGDTVSI